MRIASNRAAQILVFGLALATIGGCPIAPEVNSEVEPAVAGDYWVEPVNGDLSYFEFPEARNEPGRWVSLESPNASWYQRPGLHAFDPATGWTAVDTAVAQTLDDYIQTYDPVRPIGR